MTNLILQAMLPYLIFGFFIWLVITIFIVNAAEKKNKDISAGTIWLISLLLSPLFAMFFVLMADDKPAHRAREGEIPRVYPFREKTPEEIEREKAQKALKEKEHKDATKTYFIIGAVLLTVIFGGLSLISSSRKTSTSSYVTTSKEREEMINKKPPVVIIDNRFDVASRYAGGEEEFEPLPSMVRNAADQEAVYEGNLMNSPSMTPDENEGIVRKVYVDYIGFFGGVENKVNGAVTHHALNQESFRLEYDLRPGDVLYTYAGGLRLDGREGYPPYGGYIYIYVDGELAASYGSQGRDYYKNEFIVP
jgi:hypothetical protein